MQETINDNQQTAKEYTDDKPFRLIRHYSLTSNQGNDCQNGSSKNREPLDWILYQYIEKCIHETYPFMGKLIFLNWRPHRRRLAGATNGIEVSTGTDLVGPVTVAPFQLATIEPPEVCLLRRLCACFS